jgi:hypothetical protein
MTKSNLLNKIQIKTSIMTSFIITTEEKVKEIVKAAIYEVEQEKEIATTDATYSVAAVAKRLKMAHATVKKLIREDYLAITKNGRVTEKSINEFLKSR